MTTVDSEPEHLLVQQSVFAGEHFWAALDRLAARLGHGGHQRYLVGASEHTDRYALECATCGQAVATMVVERERPAPTPATPGGAPRWYDHVATAES